MDDIQIITSIIQDVGVWAIFAWLYIMEKRDHRETRMRHNDDLREIAGMRHQLVSRNNALSNQNPISSNID